MPIRKFIETSKIKKFIALTKQGKKENAFLQSNIMACSVRRFIKHF